MADRADSTRRNANRLGQLTRAVRTRDRLGAGDRTDIYEFRLRRASRVTLTSRSRRGTRLLLLNRRGQAIERSQGRRHRLQALVDAGRYFIKVSLRGRKAKNTPYRFAVRPQALPEPPSAPPLPMPGQPAPTPAAPPVALRPTRPPTPITPPIPTSPPQPAPVAPPAQPPATPTPPPALQRYDFTYHYRPNSTSGDRYQGYVIAPARTYGLGWHDVSARISESGFNGRYRITRVSDANNPQQRGQVFINSYTDVNGSAQTYQPYYNRRGLPSGRAGLGSELDYIDLSNPGQRTAPLRRFGQDFYAADPALTQISNFAFSGNEGDTGRFQLRLTRRPPSLVSLRFTRDSALTVDADGDISNGTQDTLTFTPENWNQAQTVQFVAEPDGTTGDRRAAVNLLLSGGLTTAEAHELGTIRSTSAPNPSQYNIDLDFRADSLGFWTPARRQILQRAAQDWSRRVAFDLPDIRLDQVIALKQPIPSNLEQSISLESNRHIDDLVVFMGAYDAIDGAGAWGNVQVGASSEADPLPRASIVTINQRYAVNYTDDQLYWLMAHELGHALGLIRQSAAGRRLIYAPSPETAVFLGRYAAAANNGQPVPLRSQDAHDHNHGSVHDYGHPAASVDSILGYTQRASQPTAVDFGMLADIGYRIEGINA